MDNKVFTLIIVVILTLFLVIGLVTKKSNDPVLQQILTQQTALLEMQGQIGKPAANSNSGIGNDALVNVLSQQKVLELRLNSLETKLNQLASRPVAAPQGAPQPSPQAPPPIDFNKIHDLPLAHTPLIGPKTAKITITEFLDFECPFCSRFHAPIVKILKAYPNDVNYVLKNFPLSFHPNAKSAAKAAFAAAEQGKYKVMVNALLDNSKSLNQDTYIRLAKELGLDVNKYTADLKKNDAKYEDMITKDMQLGAKAGVRGTPSYFLNGKVTTARDEASWKREIDAILKK